MIHHDALSLWGALALFVASDAAIDRETPQNPPEVQYGRFVKEITGLAEPAAVAIAADERIFVIESLTARVRVFDSGGTEVSSFGQRGFGAAELMDPRGIALGADGAVFVSDTGNHRVQVFDRDGRWTRSFGTRGSRPGELCGPLGLAVAADRVYVADAENHRIQVFDREGQALAAFGSRGHGRGEFARPAAVAVDASGNIYVADSDNQRVQKLDRDGKWLRSWGDFGPYEGLVSFPSDIRLHQGKLYVTDQANHRIQVFDTEGNLLAVWGVHGLMPREGGGKFHYPESFAIAPSGAFAVVAEAFEDRCQILVPGPLDNLIPPADRSGAPHYGSGIDTAGIVLAVCDPTAPSSIVLDLTQNVPIEITRFGSWGDKFGSFRRIVDVEFDGTGGTLYVSDPGNARISAFDVARKPGERLRFDPRLSRFVRSVDVSQVSGGSDAQADDGAQLPVEVGALEWSPKGRLYAIDSANARVLVFDPDLARSSTLLDFGAGDAHLNSPTDLAFDRAGETLYVVDAAEARVKAFDLDGKPKLAWGARGAGASEFVRPFGICAGRDGFVYVTDEGSHRVQKFDEQGRFVAQWGRQGLERVEFYKPRGIVQDAKSQVYVLDYGNHRAQILTPAGEFVHSFGARFFTEPTRKPVR